MTGTAERAEARRLPPGSHGIPAEVVARNQRERLIAAMAEVCVERGYAGASVSDIVKRAGVSSVTFYRQFADKPSCMLAAHRQLLGRLFEEVDRARGVEEDGGAKVRAAVHTALELFAADPPSARLLTVEVLAVGPEGARRHDDAVRAFGRRLRTGADPAVESPLTTAGWVQVSGMLAIVGKLVMTGEAARLPGLEGELVALMAPSA